ncbi:polysaccharide chain length determinant protein, PEP-CTERM locus subfamily [Burkholderiales bacterium JOSHI_001]|nr:polysaccharide chain length determinant protein, PEP-CTERM locus subfamily [Burkholderiales bacterium JOSHI_001]
MEELLVQLASVARNMWRFRWPAVFVAWLVGALAAVAVFLVPDKFEASARIYVDTQSILKPLMSGLAVQPNVEQQVTMLSRTLISRPNVEKLVRMADLDLKTSSKSEQESLVTDLMAALQIKTVGRDNLYTLSYRDSESARAQRVIQSLVSIFVESSLGSSRKDTDTAKVFINEQIKTYQAKLEEAESRLKEFRLRNLNMQVGEGKDTAARIAELGEQLNRAKLELREAEQSRDAARQQLAVEKAEAGKPSAITSILAESAASIATPEIDSRIDAQRRNLDTLLQRYTDQHPDIVSTRRLIAELEEQKKKEVAELRRLAAAAPAAAPAVTATVSLASQELNRVLATSEIQVAALKARVAEFTSRYNQAREMLKTAPMIESEAAQLNRDYAIHKKNYEDLVARRESAAMAGDLEVAAGVADFRLIDPPRVSPTPVSPNRLLLLAAAMLAALAAGLFTAFAASQLRPVFHSASELRNKLDLPLLGVVSMLTNEIDLRRKKMDMYRFVLTSGSLMGLYVTGIAVMAVLAARQG